MFFHHPDGLITIQSKDGLKLPQIPLADFLKLEPEYVLDSKFKWRQYVQTGRDKNVKGWHVLNTGADQSGGEFPWMEGDKYIGKVDQYIETLNNPPRSLDTAKKEAESKAYVAYSKAKKTGSDFEGNNFGWDAVDANALLSAMHLYGFSPETEIHDLMKSSAGDPVIMSLKSLQDLNVKLAQLKIQWADKLKTWLNQIAQSKSVEDVDAIDFDSSPK